MGEREQRIAANETTFRSANEDLRRRWDELDLAAHESMFVCECGETTCTRVIRLTLAEYEQVRSDPNTFAVLPDHDDPATEGIVTADLVSRNDRFAVVRKRPEYRDVTEATDPRR